MLKKIAFIAMLLTLAACSNSDPTYSDADGYWMEPSERIAERPIKFNLYNSDRALRLAFKSTPEGRQLADNEEMFGFTVISTQACTVNIVDPAIVHRPEEMGHEIDHCLYGNWHPRQDEAR